MSDEELTFSSERDMIEVKITRADGSEEVFRRCGAIPDLFASAKGEIIRLQENRQRVRANGYPSVSYREHGISARALVADAWLPGWRDNFDSIELLDGNKDNCALENLEPVVGGKGRPVGGEVTTRAEIFQVFKLIPDVEQLAEHFGVSEKEVLAAVKMFDPAALKVYIARKGLPKRQVRAMHLHPETPDEGGHR